MLRPSIALLGTFDTKGAELRYVSSRLVEHGCVVIPIDVGVFVPANGSPLPEIGAGEVATAAGSTLEDVRLSADRGAAVEVMASGASVVVARLLDEGRLDGVLVLGGSGGASIGASALRSLPLGLPKLMVSTIAAGDTRPYLGMRDIVMAYPLVDIAGLNDMSRSVFDNAAAAMAGMAKLGRGRISGSPNRVAATMFGVTTKGVGALREELERRGREVWTFHASGYGGATMESLLSGAMFGGVADVTTTELADELVGGVCSAGPDRLLAAVAAGVPQIISLGALDMVNFGPLASVPDRFRHRLLLQHNANVTLMRTSAEECHQLGQILGQRVDRTKVALKLFVPTQGMSAVSVTGMPFHDPDADQALVESLRATVTNPLVGIELFDCDINDLTLARAMAEALDDLMASGFAGC